VSPDDDVDEAIELMEEKAIRRVVVVEDGKPVGIVTLGDLAIERDPDSVLGQVSAAPANQ
jgi:predicted transcriptional regulator